MATITVAEHATVDVHLADEAAAAIHAGGYLAVSPLGSGRYRIKADHRVGIVRYGEVEVRIVPKVPITRLLYLAAHGELDDAWSELEASLGAIDDPCSALAAVLVWHVERALRPTPLQGYRVEEASERHLRGRVLFDRQISRRAGIMVPVELRFDEYDVDVVENRVLLAALRAVETVAVEPAPRRAVRHLRRRLDGVTPWATGRAVPEIPWTRLNLRYRPAIRLARLLLARGSLEFGDRGAAGRGFVLDMHNVFEVFLTAAIRDALTAFGGEVRAQHRTALDEGGALVMYPDITWWRGGCCRAVIDAKYKRTRNANHPNADAYQMLAYCTRLDLDEGWLVYAAIDGERPAPRVIRGAGVTVHAESIELGGSIERLQASVVELARRIAAGSDRRQALAGGREDRAMPG